MKCGLEHGNTIIRIYQPDVWEDSYDWGKILLDHIKLYDTPQIIYLAKDPKIYDNHKAALSTQSQE